MARSRSVSARLAGCLCSLALAGPSLAGTTASAPIPASTVQIAPGASGLTAAAMAPADPATRARVAGWMDQLASGWTPNRGQIADVAGRPAPQVLFTSHAGDAQVYVTTTGLSHYFLKHSTEPEADRFRHAPGPVPNADAGEVRWCRVDVSLAGARIRADRARLDDPLENQGGTSYYLPQCPNGVTDVPLYGRITFPDVYPGIDWVVRNLPGEGVHQDFVVHPGADPARIRLEYAGATALDASADGRSLRIRTPLGEVREGSLSCSQSDGHAPVGARFHLVGNAATIDLGAYDHAAPLVIDPPMVWCTYYGGTSHDGPRTIWCDNANGVVYVVGYTYSADLPLLNPGGSTFYQGTVATSVDAFVWKFTQAGVRLWATYYGGSGQDFAADCTTDAAGDLFLTGYTYSTDFPTKSRTGAYNQTASGGAGDAFVLEFDASGVRLWATYFGGSGTDTGNGITVDAAGKVYVCGYTTSVDMPVLDPGGGAFYQSTYAGGGSDAFLARFGTAQALEWSTYFGGSAGGGSDEMNGITVAGSNLYVTGDTQSSDLPVLNPGGGAYFQAYGGSVDAFVGRFTLAGVQTWTTFYGGTGGDYADEPVVDASGNLFVFGDCDSPDLPTLNPGGGAYYQGTFGGVQDFFLLKFSPTAVRLWATYYGGSGSEFLGLADKPLAIDAQGRIYVTGMTGSTDLPVLNPGGGSFYSGTFGGLRDGMLGEFSNSGTMLWSTYFGSNLGDFGTGVSIGAGGCLFATGESSGTNNLVTLNPGGGAYYQGANAGGDDGYIARFCSPNSACCVDFTCVPVFSQAQCTAMGGTAFFPNQPCSTTVCNTMCTICGHKFADLNHNGVQDGGEPALSGWTIQLVSPSGAVYATTVTDGTGSYCFHNIPCGAWTVAEAMQPAWVQTFPSPAGHHLTLSTGTTQNGVDFGNFQCAPSAPCVLPPPHLVAWWPFDEAPGSTKAFDAVHLSPARNVADVVAGAGAGVPDALCLESPGDFARVPNAGQLGLEFAGGSFAIETWLNVDNSSAGPRVVVEKRLRLGGSAPQTRGWALYLDGLQAVLELGTGAATQTVPGPLLAAGAWSHLAVSLDRKMRVGRWYLNGSPVAGMDFQPLTGLVSSSADLYVGTASPPFAPAAPFQGCIGDLALFASPLTDEQVARAAGTGPVGWCPEYSVMPSVTTYCQTTTTTATVCFSIGNNHATAQSFHWSLAGLPAGPGCTVAGPSLFSPNAGTVVVAAGGISAPICVTIPRPSGMTAQNATACFQLTFVNDATGACHAQTGTLRADNGCWCATPLTSSVVPLQPGLVGATIGIGIHVPCDTPTSLAYQIRAVWIDPDAPDPAELRLNGLPPGEPVIGTLTSARGNDQQLAVTATLAGDYDPAARYELVLEADTDGDGVADPLCSAIVVPVVYDSTEIVSVPVAPPGSEAVRLTAAPNPFTGGTAIAFTLPAAADADLGVFDLSGRLVRSLQRGRLAAGAHRFVWNARDDSGRRVPAGVYFVHLDTPEVRLQTKLVRFP